MKKIILLISFCFPFILIGQSKIEIIGSINVSDNNFLDTVFVIPFLSSSPKLNYHFGINYYEKLNRAFSIKIGLGFASMGYKTYNNPDFRYGNQQDGTIAFSLFFTEEEYWNTTILHNIHLLDIPIGLRYQPSSKKFKLFVEAGILTRYYLQTFDKIVKTNDSQVQTYQDAEIRNIHFAFFTNLGFNYPINEKMDFTFQPNLRYHLTKTSKKSIKDFEYSLGVALGLSFNLK